MFNIGLEQSHLQSSAPQPPLSPPPASFCQEVESLRWEEWFISPCVIWCTGFVLLFFYSCIVKDLLCVSRTDSGFSNCKSFTIHATGNYDLFKLRFYSTRLTRSICSEGCDQQALTGHFYHHVLHF